MKKKYKLIVIFSMILVFLLFLFLCNHFMFFRIYYKDPNILADTEWYSSVNNICLKSYYDEDLQMYLLTGKLTYNDEIVDVDIGIKYGRLFFRCEQFSLIMSAEYKLNKDGNIVLKNISYIEESYWPSTPKKIILQRKDKKTGDD